MLFSRIQLDEGAVVSVAALMMFETYEFNLKTRKPSPERNKMIARSIDLSLKRMLPQYPVVTLIDERFFTDENLALPDVVIGILLRTELTEKSISTLLVACVQEDAKTRLDEPNLNRIKSLAWTKLAKEYRI